MHDNNKNSLGKDSPLRGKAFPHFISGLFGSFLSVTVCHPLEIARVRLNLQNATPSPNKYKGLLHALATVFKEEGYFGFYKGYNATIVSIPIFYSLFFTIYSQAKVFIESTYQIKGFKNHLISSITTGAICDFITNPLWIVRTRMQTEFLHHENRYKTVFQSLKLIYKEEGFLAYFKGYAASLIGLSHAAIQFPAYEKIKEYLSQGRNATAYDILYASMLSKSIASTLTYPHILLRTRLFDSKQTFKSGLTKRLRIKNLFFEILRNEGIRGFYRGLGTDLIRVIPSNSITFLVYELMSRFLIEI